MPPGLAAALGDSAVRDLIAYLTSPAARKPSRCPDPRRRSASSLAGRRLFEIGLTSIAQTSAGIGRPCRRPPARGDRSCRRHTAIRSASCAASSSRSASRACWGSGCRSCSGLRARAAAASRGGVEAAGAPAAGEVGDHRLPDGRPEPHRLVRHEARGARRDPRRVQADRHGGAGHPVLRAPAACWRRGPTSWRSSGRCRTRTPTTSTRPTRS